MLLYQILAYIIHGKTKKLNKQQNNKLKTLAPTWNEEFELPNAS